MIPWTRARQALLSSTASQSWVKFMLVASMTLSIHLILCRLLLYLSILKEIKPKCSLEGQILKLRLQYFGHLMRREDSLEKPLVLGKCEGKRRRGRQRMRWLDRTEANSMNLTQLREAMEDRRAWRALVHGVTKSRTRLND